MDEVLLILVIIASRLAQRVFESYKVPFAAGFNLLLTNQVNDALKRDLIVSQNSWVNNDKFSIFFATSLNISVLLIFIILIYLLLGSIQSIKCLSEPHDSLIE